MDEKELVRCFYETLVSQNRLEEHHQQQAGHAEEKFGQAHQQGVQPFGRAPAGRAEEDGKPGGDRRRPRPDGQGEPSP